MSYKCDHCSIGEIDRYYQTGVLLVPPEDRETFPFGSSMTLRFGAQLKPMAMLVCPHCGVATFLAPVMVDLYNLQPIPYENATEGTDALSEKEKIQRARQTLDDLAKMVDRSEKE